MQTKLRLFVLALASTAAAAAAPLTATTAVHTKPDANATVLTVLNAGSEPVVANEALSTSPAGWLPVTISGPIEGYVQNKDITKGLDVRAGASLYKEPKTDSGVLVTISESDKTEITGLRGRWTQIRVDKPVVGYIHLGSAPAAASVPAAAPVSEKASPAPAPIAPAPVAPTAYGTSQGAGQPPPVVALNDPNRPSLPRLFQGKFVSTRSAFRPRRPYDWAVEDDAGTRYAYLDISKLLLTDQIENYVNHTVVVYGAARPVPGTKDIVIEVESLQLK